MKERDWLGGWLWFALLLVAMAALHAGLAVCDERGNWCSIVDRGE